MRRKQLWLLIGLGIGGYVLWQMYQKTVAQQRLMAAQAAGAGPTPATPSAYNF